MRTVGIGVFAFVGGLCLSQGAARQWWRLSVLGLVLMSISLGIILSGRGVSRKMRQHGQAIIQAAFIARLFRMFR